MNEDGKGITSVSLENFLAFQGKFHADFCPGVNVFIGGNGSGKTTLLKVLHMALCSGGAQGERILPPGETFFSSAERTLEEHFPDVSIARKIDSVGEDASLIELEDIGEQRDFRMYLSTARRKRASASELTRVGGIQTTCFSIKGTVFIPTIDLLAATGQLLALDRKHILPFDITAMDILSDAALPISREITPNAIKCLDKIKTIIGGTVEFLNDTFYTIKANGDKIPFSLEASGYRKLGLLWKLLRNGLLESGSVLFWDEPENSINPELIPHLVDILLTLQKGGVQIFIATHSYDIARWFELNKTEENALRYFNLRKTGTGIVADVADSYKALPHSVIRDAGNALLQRASQVAAGK